MTTETKFDIDSYIAEFKARITELVAEYGTSTKIPADERFMTSEKLRAAYCIDINPGVPYVQVFKQYAVDSRVWDFFVEDSAAVETKRKMSRADKVNAVLKWASENVGKEITLQDMITEGDIAYSMAKKITEDRPDVFKKIKRGLFQIRDPKADRDADKAKSKDTSDDQPNQ